MTLEEFAKKLGEKTVKITEGIKEFNELMNDFEPKDEEEDTAAAGIVIVEMLKLSNALGVLGD